MTGRKIKSFFKGDTVVVRVGEGSPIVFVEAISEVDDSDTSIHFKPKQARRLAKALKKAARKAEA